MSIAKDFVSALKEKKGTSGYDTPATVVRVEGGTAWVSIPGGVDETPVKMTMNAKPGEVVNVRLSGGRAWMTGNSSAPPTDDYTALKAQASADNAESLSRVALDSARSAQDSAATAATAAATAVEKADIASDAAESAQASADQALEDAATAASAASSAQTSANQAITDAAAASAAASSAQTSATNAQTSATAANTAANNALQGLATVEGVVDLVNWFAEHKKATTDTTVQSGKAYYIYNSTTGELRKVEPEGTENPSQEGWFEMDEAIADYVATHVASTSDGLSVLSAANGWRVLISSGAGQYAAGVYIINPEGDIVQESTSSGVAIGNKNSGQMNMQATKIFGIDLNSVKNFEISTDGEDISTLVTLPLSKGVPEQNALEYILPEDLVSDFYVQCSVAFVEFLLGGSPTPTYYPVGFQFSYGVYETKSQTIVDYAGTCTVSAAYTQSDEGDYISLTFSKYIRPKILGTCYVNLEGISYTKAIKSSAFTFGTRAINYVGGNYIIEKGKFSATVGELLTASGSHQLVIGKHNADDPTKLFVIGYGTASQKKNIFTVDWEGNIEANNIGTLAGLDYTVVSSF